MKFSLEHGAADYRIRSYEPGRITINQQRFDTTVLLTPESLSTAVAAQSLEALTLEDLQPAIDWAPELILLGTGPCHRFPPRTVIREVIRRQIGFEAMETTAACRTFNLLCSEQRRVAALLLLQ